MRVWDIAPGYLDGKRLLGEHLEVHAIHSVLVNRHKGYSKHPETLRWKGHIPALLLRHELLAVEMSLRGYNHKSQLLPRRGGSIVWPRDFIDAPFTQFALVKRKIAGTGEGRIPIPRHITRLWAQSKYSVMARDQKLYRTLGSKVARGMISFEELAAMLVALLRIPPAPGELRNTIMHMWGYVSDYAPSLWNKSSLREIMEEIIRLATTHRVAYLLHSTALADLTLYLKRGRYG